jgi:glyoxylase-like metal-dependent hydrolase (beta-lactamase superfamily II)
MSTGENGVLELQQPGLASSGVHGAPLQCFTKISSEKGLSSVTTLIVGSQACVVIDPPFLKPDAEEVVTFIKEKTELPVIAVFSTHHHPDHVFGANPIIQGWPGCKYLAHDYVRKGIDREYDEKVMYWPKVSELPTSQEPCLDRCAGFR